MLALHAVSKVNVEYSNVSSPHLNMRQIISSGDKTRIRVEKEPDAAERDGKLSKIQSSNVNLLWFLFML
jgi:hypothetical protein